MDAQSPELPPGCVRILMLRRGGVTCHLFAGGTWTSAAFFLSLSPQEGEHWTR